MRKRLLSLVLAFAMVLGSVNVTFSDEADVLASDAIEAADEAVADEIASGDSIDPPGGNTGTPEGQIGPYVGEDGELAFWPTTSPWKAAVYGDCGDPSFIPNLGNLTATNVDGSATKHRLYGGVYKDAYEVNEITPGKEVQMRMGYPEPDDTGATEGAGKVSDGGDGKVMYYRKLLADDDFTITATANVNAVMNTNSQVSFGLSVANDIEPFVIGGAGQTTDSVNVGPFDMEKPATNDGNMSTMSFGYIRIGGAQTKLQTEESDDITGYKVPEAGDSIKLSLKKSGDIYTLKYGSISRTYDAAGIGLTMADEIYAGLYVSRAADVTFTNVNLYVTGETAEVPGWSKGGNGMNAWTDKVDLANIVAEPDNVNPTHVSIELTGDVGKMESKNGGEESYSYYAVQTPAGLDFKFDTTINSISVNPGSNNHQTAAGIILFDQHYAKAGGSIPEDIDVEASYANSIFIGLVGATDSNGPFQIMYRINKEGQYSKTSLIGTTIEKGQQAGPYDISLIKSGDNLKIKIKDSTMTEYQTADVDISGVLENNQYIGFMAARDGKLDADITKFEVGSKKISSIEVAQMPYKTEYYTTTDKFDEYGLQLRVIYEDGTEDIIDNPDEYALSGFDDSVNRTFATAGQKTVTASIGKASVDFPVTVRARKVTSLNVDYAPVYDTFYAGGRFNTVGLQVTATYEDGNTEILKEDQYKLTIGNTEIKNGGIVTSDMAGDDIAVTVQYTDATPDVIDPNGITDTFNVRIQPGTLKELKIATHDFKTVYYVGESIGRTPEDTVPAGLTILGVFEDPAGNQSTQFIPSDLWEVAGFDTSVPVERQTLTIRLKDNHAISTTYTISVKEKFPITSIINSYPRFTYSVNEYFSAEGLDIYVVYSDNSKVQLDAQAYYYRTPFGYYKVYRADDTADPKQFSKGESAEVTEEEALAADFYVDITDYNSKQVGTTSVTICFNKKYGIASENKSFPVSIVESTDYVWKGTIFGASSLGVKPEDESSSITATYKDGRTEVSDKTTSGVLPALMENGELSQIDNVKVTSWGGAGKFTGDQDGLAYYYTKVDASKNFSLSADITVNRYIFTPEELTGAQKAMYERYLAQGLSEVDALDRLRTGQEAFGIMARDIIPYGGTLGEDGKYTGGVTNHMTPYPDKAAQKEYTFMKQDGTTVSYVLPVDIYEAYASRIYPEGYDVTRKNVEAQFTSNVVVAGGCTDSTYPSDPSSSSYYKKSIMNRINIMTRYGVTSIAGGGERIGIHSTTDHVPAAGDEYTITLTKMNTGYYITTYDHITGTTNVQYSTEYIDGTEDALEKIDPENIYVGFFATRYADITVRNIKLNESVPETDPNIYQVPDETTKPTITVESPYYTTGKEYNLILKSNSSANMTGGMTNIYMNGKTLYKDVIVDSKATSFNVELKPDYVNQFSVVYYPNTADSKFASYDPVIVRFTVTHKSFSDVSLLYVGPNGSVEGDGTRENPVSLELALALVGNGGEIVMLDGTYHKSNRDVLDIQMPHDYSGTADRGYKTLRADEGAHPVIDLEHQFAGFNVDADYWYFKGIEMCNSVDNEKAFGLSGNHVVVEDCEFHDNGTTGFQISKVNTGDNTIAEWPSYNLIKSSESFNNVDSSKNNADGFAAKLTVGYGNVFEDCISHHNLDDGWDCYTKINSGAIGAVVLENCITYRQGYQLQADGTDIDFNATSGGNGYRLGGEGIYVKHMLKDCLAFNCKSNGIDSNNNPAIKIRNVIAYNNGMYNFALYSNTPIPLSKNGNSEDENGRVYKFDYDIEGAVSSGNKSFDRIGSLNEEVNFGNISDKEILNKKNYLKVAPEGVFLKDANNSDLLNRQDYIDIPSSNGYTRTEDVTLSGGSVSYANYVLAQDADIWNVDTDFKSIDFEATAPGQRYQRNEDGSFKHGDFLARTEPYEHNAEDIVTLPDYLGGLGGVGGRPPETDSTQTTTESSSQTTTGAPSEPTTGAVSEPTTGAPSEPTTGAPSEPTTDAASEPTTGSVSEPTTAAPTTVAPSGTETSTEATTSAQEPGSEITTAGPNQNNNGGGSGGGGRGPSGGGGGGGGSSTKSTTTESTTEITTANAETNTETTTEKTDTATGDEVKSSETVTIPEVKVSIGNQIISINDKSFDMGVAPYIQASSNSTLVPLRFVAAVLSGDDIANAENSKAISWNAVTKQATVSIGENKAVFTSGSGTVEINGVAAPMENGAMAEIRDSRMFVPFRALGTFLGVNVEWDANTKTAIYKVK